MLTPLSPRPTRCAFLVGEMPTALVVRLIFWLWFGAAFLAGQQLLLQRLPPLAIPAVVLGLSALLLAAYFRLAAVRAWVDALNLRPLVFLHVTRFVGVYFLVLYRRGLLPYDFAVPGGIGDIVVAVLALALTFAPMAEAAHERAVRIWNILGLVDIALVVLTAARLNLESPLQMRALTYLPLSLLPTFLVPLIVATHVVIFVRLNRPRAAA
ncbi:MAG: hypothetical protein NTV51_05335 [Verrucomicrobia bacterium]|nr:hypothetical protein [Verrucomicrobiota bacterium]